MHINLFLALKMTRVVTILLIILIGHLQAKVVLTNNKVKALLLSPLVAFHTDPMTSCKAASPSSFVVSKVDETP